MMMQDIIPPGKASIDDQTSDILYIIIIEL